jgi:hypothetical protein
LFEKIVKEKSNSERRKRINKNYEGTVELLSFERTFGSFADSSFSQETNLWELP